MIPASFPSAEAAARHAEHEKRLHAWRIENRRRLGLRPLWTEEPTIAADHAPAAPSPTYRKTPNADEAAAAAILDAFRVFEPATANKPTPAGHVTGENDAAVATILGAFCAANPN